MRACTNDNCTAPHRAKGLCAKHLSQAQRSFGVPEKIAVFVTAPLRYSYRRDNPFLHLQARIWTEKGNFLVTACAHEKVGKRKVWRNPRTGPKPPFCPLCLDFLRQHDLI